MGDWKSILKVDPTNWLLEEENPSIRYFTLTEIMDKPAKSPEAKEAKKEIMSTGLVPKILSKMNEDGYWETPTSFYTAKYRGTAWQLLILAELGADTTNDRVRKACEFVLENSQHRESHGFSMAKAEKTGGGRQSGVIPCLTGNMVWSFIRLGYIKDTRVQDAINWITNYQRFDDGIETAPSGWPYDRYEMCWGKHTCHMGAVKALKALTEIPAEKRDSEIKATIEKGTEYILKHHIFKRSHDLSKVSKPSWLHFGFPLMYQTDALEVLGILTKIACKDDRMYEAVELVLSKQNASGKWKLENTFNGRFQTDIERKNENSKWVTLNVLKVLKRLYS